MDAPRFKPGDLVRVQRGFWRVVADDTNRTPVHDPEPAYRLSRADSRKVPKPERYAYESELEAV